MQDSHRWISIALGLALSLGALNPAASQTETPERLPTDATIRIVNGTTGEPGRAERLLLREPGAILRTIAERHDVEGAVTFTGLMMHGFSPYIATAWIDGVAYHAQQNGQDFQQGRELVVYGFEQTDSLAGLAISGLNVVVRERLEGFSFESIVIVENKSRPQRTIAAEALPVQLSLPPDLQRREVEISGGPDGRTAELRPVDRGLEAIAVALPPGQARIIVRGLLPDTGRFAFDVAANLPVEAWSLLAWPAELPVQSSDLELDRENSYAEFSRWLGKPLRPDQTVRITIDRTPSPVELTDDAAPEKPQQIEAKRPAERRFFPWRTAAAVVILLGIYVIWRRRRA